MPYYRYHSRFAYPLSIKFEPPTVVSLKRRAKKERKAVSALIRELVVLALARSANGRRSS